MNNEFIIKAMDNNYYRTIDESQKFTKSYGIPSSQKLNTLAGKIGRKAVKYLYNSKEYDLEVPKSEVSLILKKKIDNKKYTILKESYSDNVLILYIDIFYLEFNYKGGIAVFEITDDNKVKVTLFYRRQLKLNSLNIDKTFLYFEKIFGVTDTAADVHNNLPDENQNSLSDQVNSPIDSYKNIKGNIYPLEKSVYLDREYIHPSLKQALNTIREYDEKEYEDAKRIVLNNNYQSNKLNRYVPAIIASNLYQKMDFPIIGEQPDLEEFTDEYVWYDERIFLHTLANEYITFDSPDIYTSTTASFGNVSLGNISFRKGKEAIGWDRMSSGDFYITERQIIIFEKGKFSLAIRLLDADNYKRGVISISLNDIDVVEGDTELGILKIYKKNNKVHAFQASNTNREKIKFSEDELRYMVNLIGSLIEKKQKY